MKSPRPGGSGSLQQFKSGHWQGQKEEPAQGGVANCREFCRQSVQDVSEWLDQIGQHNDAELRPMHQTKPPEAAGPVPFERGAPACGWQSIVTLPSGL